MLYKSSFNELFSPELTILLSRDKDNLTKTQ